MPLTPEEDAFMAHLAHEYMNARPGPACRQFLSWGLQYLPDYHWLFEANVNHLQRVGVFDGDVRRPAGEVPPVPWAAAEVVRTRNAELEAEVRADRRGRTS